MEDARGAFLEIKILLPFSYSSRFFKNHGEWEGFVYVASSIFF